MRRRACRTGPGMASASTSTNGRTS
jgi:hypothetical protein